MRALVLASLVASAPALAAEPAAEYVPAPARDIPGYSENAFSCKEVLGWWTSTHGVITPEDLEQGNLGPWRFDPGDVQPSKYVVCDGEPYLQRKSLRELSLLRNTIYARYGWAGFRKTWLREHFQKQPWYRPDPNFSYKRLSKADRRNVELIAQAEMSWRYDDLLKLKEPILARAGKWWGDLPSYETKRGKTVHACDLSDYKGKTTMRIGEVGSDETHEEPLSWVTSFQRAAAESKDCQYHGEDSDAVRKHRSNQPTEPDLGTLSAEDSIELGLLSRAMGDFALDEGQRSAAEGSLDSVLPVKDLRQLSLRDLRLLRNTIYARRGRPFKSPLLQEHFNRMPWYKADPAYTDKRLTKTDKRNIDLIVQVENEFGGALHDKDFMAENPLKDGVEEPVPITVQA